VGDDSGMTQHPTPNTQHPTPNTQHLHPVADDLHRVLGAGVEPAHLAAPEPVSANQLGLIYSFGDFLRYGLLSDDSRLPEGAVLPVENNQANTRALASVGGPLPKAT
jgi:hypothetical protein